MAKCVKCEKNLSCDCGAPAEVGSVSKPCPLMDGGLWVHFLDDAGNNIKDVPALKGSDKKNSDASGLAIYDPLSDGEYDASMDTLPKALADEYVPPKTTKQSVKVQKGQIAYVGFALSRKAQLKVKVAKKGDTPKVFGGATVEISDGPDKPPKGTTDDTTGLVDFKSSFGKLQPGAYKIKAELKKEDAKTHQTAKDFAKETEDIDLGPGEDKTLELEVEPKNLVKPLIEVEYLVVLLDQDLKKHQDVSETDKIKPADTTCVELSFSELDADDPKKEYKGTHKYAGGGVFKCDPANVKIFTDEKCTTELGSTGELDKTAFASGKKLKLYLRGTKAGKFKATLALKELKDISDPTEKTKLEPDYRFIQLWEDPKKAGSPAPAEIEMGVVKLEMKLHTQDISALAGIKIDPDKDPISDYHTALKDEVLPKQKDLTTVGDKIKVGRLLHVQKDDTEGKGNFGRARLLIPKLEGTEADCWPKGSEDYEIVIQETNTSGSVALHAKEWDKDLKAFPHKIKVSDLKSAEQELWVEGKSATAKVLEVMLDLGVNRAKKDASNADDPHTAEDPPAMKRYGDACRFSVVEIKEVKFDFSNDLNKAVIWDGTNKRFYINTDTDPSGRELKNKPAKGRKIKITAELTEKIKDVTIHFMLSPNKDNHEKAHWGANLPNTFKFKDLDRALKAKDKAAPDEFLHFSAKTDANGVAEMDKLVLSRFGGDKFKIGAYIDQDAHLAKYIDQHTDLSKKKPALSDEFQIWRKIWVQNTRNLSSGLQGRGSTVTAFEAAFIEYKEAPEHTFDVTTLGLGSHPEWQFTPGGGNTAILCVGDHNKASFHGMFVAATDEVSPKAHLVMCDKQWDPILGPQLDFAKDTLVSTVNYPNATNSKWLGVFNPPLGGGSIVAVGLWAWSDGINIHRGTLTDTEVTVEQTRGHTSEVQVSIPAVCPGTCPCGAPGTAINPTALLPVQFRLRLNAATGPWAGESGQPGHPHCLIVINANSNQFNNTIIHEIGHLHKSVRTDASWHGLPDHPDQYIERGGQGSHCKKDTSEHATALDQSGNKVYVGGTCAMFHVAVGNVAFCHNCGADLRVRDLSDFFK